MQPLFSGWFGQRMADSGYKPKKTLVFAALAAEKQKWKKWCEYFVSFGEEEAVKMAEQYLDIRIRRIPLQKNALMVTGESMTFFGKFLR